MLLFSMSVWDVFRVVDWKIRCYPLLCLIESPTEVKVGDCDGGVRGFMKEKSVEGDKKEITQVHTRSKDFTASQSAHLCIFSIGYRFMRSLYTQHVMYVYRSL